MYFNVVVSESDSPLDFLAFKFGCDIEKAQKFCELVLKTSDYRVEIIPVLIEEEKEE